MWKRKLAVVGQGVFNDEGESAAPNWLWSSGSEERRTACSPGVSGQRTWHRCLTHAATSLSATSRRHHGHRGSCRSLNVSWTCRHTGHWRDTCRVDSAACHNSAMGRRWGWTGYNPRVGHHGAWYRQTGLRPDQVTVYCRPPLSDDISFCHHDMIAIGASCNRERDLSDEKWKWGQGEHVLFWQPAADRV